MISYVTIGVNDIQQVLKFYDAVLGALGHKRVFATDSWLGYTLADGFVPTTSSRISHRLPVE